MMTYEKSADRKPIRIRDNISTCPALIREYLNIFLQLEQSVNLRFCSKNKRTFCGYGPLCTFQIQWYPSFQTSDIESNSISGYILKQSGYRSIPDIECINITLLVQHASISELFYIRILTLT